MTALAAARAIADFGARHGAPLEAWIEIDTDGHRSRVEHEGADPDIAGRFPVGTRLRVLPNHACATGARHSAYRVIDPGGAIRERPRLHGW